MSLDLVAAGSFLSSDAVILGLVDGVELDVLTGLGQDGSLAVGIVHTHGGAADQLPAARGVDGIHTGLGAGNADNFESVVYEGYGPNGVAVIIEALTDNRNRTAPEMRHLLDKYGKGLGATGCVSWSFDRKGVIVLDAEDLDEDTVMMDALEAGADDMQADDEVFEVYTDPDAFNDVVAGMESKGYTFLEAGVQMVPQNYVQLTDETDIKNMEKLIDLLEDNDDVQNVYHNWEQD